MVGEQVPASLTSALTSLPTVYTDGVANLARGPGMVKFYLVRFDPDPTGTNESPLQTLVGQIVMSSTGFAATVLFFQKQLTEMLDRGELDREIFDQLVKGAEKL